MCVAACKALAALAPDATVRDEMLKSNALGSLVSILKENTNKEVGVSLFYNFEVELGFPVLYFDFIFNLFTQ